MNEEYEKLKKRIEHQLTNELRIRQIVKITIKYFGMSRNNVLSKSQIAPLVYVRQMISYISFNVYGISSKLIAKHLKYKDRTSVTSAAQIIKCKLTNNSRIQFDLDNIRAELAKVLNG